VATPVASRRTRLASRQATRNPSSGLQTISAGWGPEAATIVAGRGSERRGEIVRRPASSVAMRLSGGSASAQSTSAIDPLASGAATRLCDALNVRPSAGAGTAQRRAMSSNRRRALGVSRFTWIPPARGAHVRAAAPIWRSVSARLDSRSASSASHRSSPRPLSSARCLASSKSRAIPSSGPRLKAISQR